MYGCEAMSHTVLSIAPHMNVCVYCPLQVVCEPAVLVGNSAGGLSALQVAVAAPGMTRGLMLLDCSMR